MDFNLPPEAEDAAALAATILKDHTTTERLIEVEAAGNRFDPVLWKALGDAGLLSLTTPESHDGAGLGFLELCRVLVEVGHTVAPVPLATDSVARLFLAERGTDDQQQAAYTLSVISAAITEEHEHVPTLPTTTAALDGSTFMLTGTKYLVPAAIDADAFLITAATPDGTGVFLVDSDASGLQIREQKLSDGDAVGLVELAGVRVPADRLIGSGDAAQRLVDLLTVASCAVQLGVTEGALKLTAEYAKVREQFDRPIGTFQAVSQRLADGYIDTRFLRPLRPPSSGRPTPATTSRTPRSTSTVASASTWTARLTATSPPRRATTSSTEARPNKLSDSASCSPPNRRDDPGPAPRAS